jgi:hypothetical protein
VIVIIVIHSVEFKDLIDIGQTMGSIKEAQFKIKTEQLKRKTSNKGQKLFEDSPTISNSFKILLLKKRL